MTDTQESIEKELQEKQVNYGELCARLGDAAYRLNQFQRSAQDIQNQIIKLDEDAIKLREKLALLKSVDKPVYGSSDKPEEKKEAAAAVV